MHSTTLECYKPMHQETMNVGVFRGTRNIDKEILFAKG